MAKIIEKKYRLAIVKLNNMLRDDEQELEDLNRKMEAARWYLAAAKDEPVPHDGKYVNGIDKCIMELKHAIEEYDIMALKVDKMRLALRKALKEVDDHIIDDTEPQEGGQAVRSLIDGEMYGIVERDNYNMNIWTGETKVDDRELKKPVSTILMGAPIYFGKDWRHRYDMVQIEEQTTWRGLLQTIRELVLKHFDNDEDKCKDMWIETIEILNSGSCLVSFGS